MRLEDLPPWAREQAERKLAEQRRGGGSVSAPAAPQAAAKYHNVPDARGRVRFDSKKEARRYDQLMVLLRAGEIRDLKLQREYTLQEAYTAPDGDRVRAIRYRADFAYDRATAPDVTGTVHWIPVVEDVKSKATATPVYQIKRKLMRERYGIEIIEI